MNVNLFKFLFCLLILWGCNDKNHDFGKIYFSALKEVSRHQSFKEREKLEILDFAYAKRAIRYITIPYVPSYTQEQNLDGIDTIYVSALNPDSIFSKRTKDIITLFYHNPVWKDKRAFDKKDLLSNFSYLSPIYYDKIQDLYFVQLILYDGSKNYIIKIDSEYKTQLLLYEEK